MPAPPESSSTFNDKMMVESLRLKNLQLEGGASRVSTSRLTELEEQLREQREKEQQLLEREAAARKKQEELLEQLQKVKDSVSHRFSIKNSAR